MAGRAVSPGGRVRSRLLGAAMVGSVACALFGAGAARGDDAPAATPAAPTWATLYRRYLATGTAGDCASCHAEAATAAQAYDWLAGQSYMVGTPPYLIDPRSSCFSWQGGDMPPGGPSSYVRASRDFAAWAEAQAASTASP